MTSTAASSLPPGAAVGTAGFPTMPFSFEFVGSFFRLEDFFNRVSGFTSVTPAGNLVVRGRLLSVDSFDLKAAPSGFPKVAASVKATAYVLPLGQGLTAGATAAGPSTRRRPGRFLVDVHGRRLAGHRGGGIHRHRRRTMTTLRNIWADLVEKRLWPVAVLLLVGVIAVPVVLAKNPEPAPTPVANAVLARDAAAKDDPTLVTLNAKPTVREHDGRGRDPFVQPKGSTPQKAQALQSSTTSGGGATPTDTLSSANGTGDTGSGSTPSKPKSTPKARRAELRRRPALRPGRLDEDPARRRAAHQPLPVGQTPFFVFLGVKSDGKTLVFLVSSDAKATGDGKCRPSNNNCENIELKVGDTEFFDVTTDDGRPAVPDGRHQGEQGEGQELGQGRPAARAGGKASKADRRALRKLLDGRSAHLLGPYRWMPERGVLVLVPAWAHKD